MNRSLAYASTHTKNYGCRNMSCKSMYLQSWGLLCCLYSGNAGNKGFSETQKLSTCSEVRKFCCILRPRGGPKGTAAYRADRGGEQAALSPEYRDVGVSAYNTRRLTKKAAND